MTELCRFPFRPFDDTTGLPQQIPFYSECILSVLGTEKGFWYGLFSIFRCDSWCFPRRKSLRIFFGDTPVGTVKPSCLGLGRGGSKTPLLIGYCFLFFFRTGRFGVQLSSNFHIQTSQRDTLIIFYFTRVPFCDSRLQVGRVVNLIETTRSFV